MTKKNLTITHINHLNLGVVKQHGVKFFVAAPDSFIIDGRGFLELIKGMINCGVIQLDDVKGVIKAYENKKNSADSNIG